MAFTNDELYGVANPLNAENLLQMIVGNTEPDLRFDVNQDGEISMGDVTPLLRHKTGLETDNEFINNFNQQYQQANAGGIVPAPPAGVTQAQLGQANPLTAQPVPDGGNFMLPQPLPGAGVANTRAIGEDNSMLQPNNPNAFTRAIGEDGNFGGDLATTQAIGEDGNFGPFGPGQGQLTTMAKGEETGGPPGQPQLTTMAAGEEAGETPLPGGVDSVAITMAIGENGSTFPPSGPGQGQLTTAAMGEETGGPPGQLPPPMGGPTTQAMGEEEGQPGFPGQPTPPDMHPPGLFQQPQPQPPMPLPGGNGKGGGGFQQPPAYQRPPNPFMGGGYGGYGGGFGGGFQPQPYQQPYQPQPYGGGFGGGGKGGGGGFQPQPFMPQQPYQQPYRQPYQQPYQQQPPIIIDAVPYQQPYQQPGGKGGGGGFGPQDQLFGMQNRQNAQNQQMFNMQNASPNGQQMQAQPAPAGTGGASPFGSMLGAAAGGGGGGNRTALF